MLMSHAQIYFLGMCLCEMGWSSVWFNHLNHSTTFRCGFRTAELVKRNMSSHILLPHRWWHHLPLVNWHHLWWRICNIQHLFPQTHRSSLHWLTWTVRNTLTLHYHYQELCHTRCTQTQLTWCYILNHLRKAFVWLPCKTNGGNLHINLWDSILQLFQYLLYWK